MHAVRALAAGGAAAATVARPDGRVASVPLAALPPPVTARTARDARALALPSLGIEVLDDFAALPSLTTLYVQDNLLTTLDGLQTCTALQHVYAPRNALIALWPSAVAAPRYLLELDVSHNRLEVLESVLRLLRGGCPNLRALWLAGNPCAEEADYRARVAAGLPTLVVLDDVAIGRDGAHAPTTARAARSASVPAASSAARGRRAPPVRTVVDRWWPPDARTGLDPAFTHGAASAGAPDGATALASCPSSRTKLRPP